jgi:hypothetical protein
LLSSEFHEWLIHLNREHGALYSPYTLVPGPWKLFKFPEIDEASAVLGWLHQLRREIDSCLFLSLWRERDSTMIPGFPCTCIHALSYSHYQTHSHTSKIHRRSTCVCGCVCLQCVKQTCRVSSQPIIQGLIPGATVYRPREALRRSRFFFWLLSND